jgi:hypothetical protein
MTETNQCVQNYSFPDSPALYRRGNAGRSPYGYAPALSESYGIHKSSRFCSIAFDLPRLPASVPEREGITMMRYDGKGYVVACCDRCPRKFNTGLKIFQQAVDLLGRSEGWESVEHGGKWENYCPSCSDSRVFDSEFDRVGVGFTSRSPSGDDWD